MLGRNWEGRWSGRIGTQVELPRIRASPLWAEANPGPCHWTVQTLFHFAVPGGVQSGTAFFHLSILSLVLSTEMITEVALPESQNVIFRSSWLWSICLTPCNFHRVRLHRCVLGRDAAVDGWLGNSDEHVFALGATEFNLKPVRKEKKTEVVP